MKEQFANINDWNQKQKSFYDKKSHARMWYQRKSAFVDNILDKFISLTKILEKSEILEIGCGAGRYTIPLLERGAKITGIDISAKMLEKLTADIRAFNLGSNSCQFICQDIESFLAQNKTLYDGIIGFNVLHHLYDINLCFSKFYANLKSGGMVGFVEPNARNPLHMIDTFLDKGWQAEKKKKHSIVQKVELSLRENGFREIQYIQFGIFPPFMIDACPGLLKIESWVEKKHLCEKFLPYFIITAKK